MVTNTPIAPEPQTRDRVEARPAAFPDLGTPDLETHGGGKSYWWVWVIILGAIGYGCYRLYTFENAKQAASSNFKSTVQPRAVSVSAATARTGNLPVYLEGLGTVTAFNTVTVRPRIDGQLVSVTFTEGQFVHQGQVLAQIDPRPYQVALDQARGTLAQANGTLAKDQASLRDAQVNYQRDQQLFDEKIIARQQLDTQLATADEVRGSIAADQASISAAQASINAAQLNLTYTKIVAPISGRIGLRLVDSGNLIHATDATGLAVITQLQPISVLFTVPEDELPSILKKLQGGTRLRVEAYDRDGKQKLADGTLVTVDNQIDQTTGTSRLKAEFANENMSLFPNQFVNARLWLDTERNVTIVPAVAIQRGPTGTFVYLIQPDSSVVIRPVRIGMSEGDDITINEGLQAGDAVVVDGAEKLTDGMKVNVLHPTVPRTTAGGKRGAE